MGSARRKMQTRCGHRAAAAPCTQRCAGASEARATTAARQRRGEQALSTNSGREALSHAPEPQPLPDMRPFRRRIFPNVARAARLAFRKIWTYAAKLLRLQRRAL